MYSVEVRNGLYDIERGRREMGRDTSLGKLLLCWWAYPRRCENGDVWLIPKTAEKPIDGRTKRRKGDKHEKKYCWLKMTPI